MNCDATGGAQNCVASDIVNNAYDEQPWGTRGAGEDQQYGEVLIAGGSRWAPNVLADTRFTPQGANLLKEPEILSAWQVGEVVVCGYTLDP